MIRAREIILICERLVTVRSDPKEKIRVKRYSKQHSLATPTRRGASVKSHGFGRLSQDDEKKNVKEATNTK